MGGGTPGGAARPQGVTPAASTSPPEPRRHSLHFQPIPALPALPSGRRPPGPAGARQTAPRKRGSPSTCAPGGAGRSRWWATSSRAPGTGDPGRGRAGPCLRQRLARRAEERERPAPLGGPGRRAARPPSVPRSGRRRAPAAMGARPQVPPAGTRHGSAGGTDAGGGGEGGAAGSQAGLVRGSQPQRALRHSAGRAHYSAGVHWAPLCSWPWTWCDE